MNTHPTNTGQYYGRIASIKEPKQPHQPLTVCFIQTSPQGKKKLSIMIAFGGVANSIRKLGVGTHVGVLKTLQSNDYRNQAGEMVIKDPSEVIVNVWRTEPASEYNARQKRNQNASAANGQHV